MHVCDAIVDTGLPAPFFDALPSFSARLSAGLLAGLSRHKIEATKE